MKRCLSLFMVFGLFAAVVAGSYASGPFADEKEGGKGEKGVKGDKGDKGGKGGPKDKGRPKEGDKGGPGAEKGPPRFELGNLFPPMMKDQLQLTKEQEAQLQKLEADVKEKLNKLLTADQKKMIEEFRPRGPGGPGGERPGGVRPEGDRPGKKPEGDRPGKKPEGELPGKKPEGDRPKGE